MARRARRLDLGIFLAALLAGSCADLRTAGVDSPPPAAPEPVALPNPLPIRVGITRWEPGPLADALAQRLRKTNLFAEVYYPLESGAEMDAAIELVIRRKIDRHPRFGETLAAAVTLGMAEGTMAERYTSEVDAELSLRVGERTLRRILRSTRVDVTVQPRSTNGVVWKATDECAGGPLAAELVDELSKEPEKLAAEIAARPASGTP